jgi:hypothetical protein
MTRLGDTVDGVIGVDTHRDTLAGYQHLLEFGQAQVPGRRCWAVEGAGSYGAGLTSFLQARGEWVVEVGRPKRPAGRTGAKSDALTLSGRRGRPWPTTTKSCRVGVVVGRRCGCCWPLATAPAGPR